MPRRPSPPPAAFLFFGVFSGRLDIIDDVRTLVEERYGPLHPRGESPVFPFPETQSYPKTMGSDLKKRFYVLDKRWPQDGLARVKRDAVEMEAALGDRWRKRAGVDRPVNIDPGLINDCRIILATTKDYAHRLYRGEGIWEEITLVYRQGQYRELPWTYRDFKSPEYHRFFEIFREEFLTNAPPRGPRPDAPRRA